MIRLEHAGTAAAIDEGRGMLLTSWTRRGEELLAPARPRIESVPRVDTLRGMALLAPWANRLPGDRYDAYGRSVDLARLPIERDEVGLPLHGTITGRGAWRVLEERPDRLVAALDLDADAVTAEAFPFAARLEVAWRVDTEGIAVTTTLVATGDHAVPACFGWHPYLALPASSRAEVTVRLPGGDPVPLGPTTVDEYRTVVADRTAAVVGADRTVSLSLGAGYAGLQVWMPAGEAFVCLEPMVAPVGALARGDHPWARPEGPYAASFRLDARGSD